MAEDLTKAVQQGLRLCTRLYYTPESLHNNNSSSPTTKPPRPHLIPMLSSKSSSSSSSSSLLPSAPSLYAVVTDPSIVDNPDVRSYQPYVHGRCHPPALIPLHLYDVRVHVECCVDVAVVEFAAVWRLHCVDAAKSCDCRLALPLPPQGSVLGFEVEASSGSYISQLVKVEDTLELEGLIKADNGGFLNPNIFTLKIPKVDGGSKIKVKARWSQKLIYREGQLCLSLPFSFPAYVTPVGKFMGKEKIAVNVNSGAQIGALSYSASHTLKELRRQAGKFCYSYESEVDTWSKTDFEFSYSVASRDIHGGVLVQTPPPNDLDQRDICVLYLFPGYSKKIKVFRKRVVFLIDISGSMKGAPLENVKQAVFGTLSKFNQDDSFNIIAFNQESYMFSSTMELATKDALERASEWFSSKLVPEGDVDIMLPMKQAIEMVPNESSSISYIFLVTDGAVENEKEICNVVKDSSMNKKGSPLPRISTFGIGSYCNHYFLRMLAQIGRGHYDAAYDADSIALRLERFLTVSSSAILSNIEVECLEHVESPTLYLGAIQDLMYECPLIISGRCKNKLPESLDVRATWADMSSFTTNLKIHEAKDMPLDKVYAQTQINVLTAEAWFVGSKKVEEQVAEISMQTGFPSEYTRMILVRTQSDDQGSDFNIQGIDAYDIRSLHKMVRCRKLLPLRNLGVGFGDLKKSAENLPPGVTVKTPDASDAIVKAATGCCHQFLDRFCCMCCIQAISKLSDRLVITLSQICAALSCCTCLDCCYDLCANC
ncbi:hypothetical protein vseg_004076 [Gypsophila vaccaria]